MKAGTWFTALALVLLTGAMVAPRARAQTSAFPKIASWSFAGGFCPTCPDTIVERPRTITLRFLRDRRGEARRDFGGYRIYRVTLAPDSARMMLIRRYSVNPGDNLSWYFSRVDTTDATLPFKKNGVVVHDSVITFVDPDSNGHYEKVCRIVDNQGRCISRGDSIFVLVPPPGPHDGIPTYYAVTYEGRNVGADAAYEDLYVPGPDVFDNYARCGTPGDPNTCPTINLNHKLLNVTPAPGQPTVEPTRGPTPNLERVHVVPNPYRGSEVWDQPNANEIHFINLPVVAKIKIFTVAGDLVREIDHNDPVRDFERWDLFNGKGEPVISGIYVYRIESSTFTHQDRLVVIR
jgi:hypothetical protein